ncbi:MAG: hypothetical protein QF486_00550 [Candidatus Woesearchaeota archaeon]|nr:hypothetical protein [Candidatus Woesearchaeota archaeon]MDP7181288.1 hypothetical protein [Candidatus Woesearchaeota archaeon]MDP7198093.1 hypothetical protein [Candidatus Woesearchaeota archaeon]MDP7466927.1 hypothetical protein [Candidatus Woesearchaeota archaeon]MDP7647362.1 hypothetical protein [Candidatus Woesearchaeota archaeon]
MLFTTDFFHSFVEEETYEDQMLFLQPTEEDLRGRVLDVGCGQNRLMLDYLLQQGVEAEGVDRLLESQEHIMGVELGMDSLPRPDGNYNTLLMSWFPPVYFALRPVFGKICQESMENGHRILESSVRIMTELLRVLDPEGSMLCCPGVRGLESMLPQVIMEDTLNKSRAYGHALALNPNHQSGQTLSEWTTRIRHAKSTPA